jgi:hypothetical protein
MQAALHTLRSLARPGDHVHLCVDNQVAYHYLRKSGGKLGHYNSVLRPFLKYCLQ